MDILEQLHPAARAPVVLWQDRCAREVGISLELFDAWRDGAAQDAAFAAGASKKKAGGSYHNLTYPDGRPCSLAIHGRIRTADGNKVGFGPLPLEYAGARKVRLASWWDNGTSADLTPRQNAYATVCLIAEECGLHVGGRWATLQDWCHVQKAVPGCTLEQIKAMLLHQGDIQIGGVLA